MKSKWILLFLFIPVLAYAQVNGIRGSNLDAQVLESFDDDPTSKWIARGSKFTTNLYDENGTVVDRYPKVAEVPAFPTSLFGFDVASEENRARRALGIWGKFDRRGFNYIEVIPVRIADSDTQESDIIHEDPDSGTQYVHNPVSIPGKVQFFDTWMWGSNYNYYVEAHFLDYRGITHVFRLGDLNYTGWRNMRVTIPQHIPQAEKYIPKEKPLKFTKYVIWTRPAEVVDGFFIYIDHMKVLTDLYIERFDGDNLVNPDLLEQIWGTSSTK